MCLYSFHLYLLFFKFFVATQAEFSRARSQHPCFPSKGDQSKGIELFINAHRNWAVACSYLFVKRYSLREGFLPILPGWNLCLFIVFLCPRVHHHLVVNSSCSAMDPSCVRNAVCSWGDFSWYAIFQSSVTAMPDREIPWITLFLQWFLPFMYMALNASCDKRSLYKTFLK